MNKSKNIVFTAYGHGKTIDKISVSLFEGSVNYGFGESSSVQSFCKSINSLELRGDAWIYVRTVEENHQYSLDSFFPSAKFKDIIPLMDDRSLQRVLREVDHQVLAKALKNVKNTILEAVFNNMSQRAVTVLKEDMEYMGPVREKDCEDAQEEILSIILHLEGTGEIVIRRGSE